MLLALTACPITPLTVSKAQTLSHQLDIPYDAQPSPAATHVLTVTETHLELQQPNSKTHPICVDFLSPAANHRRLQGGGKGQLIARAVGLKKKSALAVLDLTAGLGQDAFVLASLGCKVHMLERSPLLAALLADGLKRLHAHADFAHLPLTLTQADSLAYLAHLEPCYDVLYLDPMFPERNKTALVKKEMRILRDLVGEDLDAALLLGAALKCGVKRVVVKRPRIAPVIGDRKPDLVFAGQSSRFDVYFL